MVERRLDARALGTILAAAALLAGCVFGNLSEDAPPGYSLSGTWKLNPAQSTDTRQALNNLQKARTRAQREAENQAFGPQPGTRAGDVQLPPLDRPAPPDVSFQTTALRAGEWLKTEQHGEEFTVSNGDISHSYVAGQKSVVSVSSGVADQKAGWKGKEFRIEIRPQVGPSIRESYRLSDDGKQLIETVDVAREGRIPAIHVVRVYDPTTEMPQALPGGD